MSKKGVVMDNFRNNLDDLIFRIKDRSREKMEGLEYRLHLTSRWSKLSLRLIGLALLAAVVAHFLPSSADTFSNNPVSNQQIQNDTPTVASGDPSQSNDDSQTDNSDTSTYPAAPTVVYLDSGTVVAATPYITGETPVLHVPTSVKVDPRAMRINLPLINGGGGSTVEICMTANSSNIMINSTGPLFPVFQETTMVYKTETGTISTENAPVQIPSMVGNGSSQLIVTGNIYNLMNTINGNNGLFISSINGALGGRDITFAVIPLTQPSTDPTYCANGAHTTVSFQSLGLELSNAEGKIHMHA
jgi:hypothetical protein